jgi:hypothetical protein
VWVWFIFANRFLDIQTVNLVRYREIRRVHVGEAASQVEVDVVFELL